VKEFGKRVGEECEMAVTVSVSGGSWCDLTAEAVAIAAGDSVMVVDPEVQSPGLDEARDLLSGGCLKYMHYGKQGALALEKAGLTLAALSFDTALAAYLENPSLGTYNLDDVWERNASIDVEVEGAQASGELTLFEDGGAMGTRLALDAARVLHLKPVMEAKLEDLSMTSLFLEIEMPLAGVLAGLEREGVALDVTVASRLSVEAHERLDSLERGIFDIAGHEFKIGSTRQLAEVLFNELGLPPLKRTKTGYSTDSSVLEGLAAEHEIARLLLEYREYSKLTSTYFDVLPGLVCPSTGRVHGTFNQLATSTGRISSSTPNLQNIPVRTDIGRRIRAAFVARPGWKMLVADYSQIELRVLAHVSSDPLLLEAFAKDEDVHADTAGQLFGVEESEVTPEMRRVAKMVNFGVVYGMSDFGLASRLGIPRDEAAGFIDRYFDRYSGVRSYRDACISETAARGYTETLFGRRRYVPQLKSDSRQTRELGERLAVNTPLQGTAADIIKKAMVDADRALHSEGMLTRMTLQIHDELIFEVAPGEEDAAVSLAERCMSSACYMKVPLKVDMGLYDNWGEAKS
jgi:DNA polymerase-1